MSNSISVNTISQHSKSTSMKNASNADQIIEAAKRPRKKKTGFHYELPSSNSQMNVNEPLNVNTSAAEKSKSANLSNTDLKSFASAKKQEMQDSFDTVYKIDNKEALNNIAKVNEQAVEKSGEYVIAQANAIASSAAVLLNEPF